MLMLVCSCGHRAPLPESSGSYKCSQCRESISLTWFGYESHDPEAASSPDPLAEYRAHARRAAFLPARKRASVEFFVTSQPNG